MRRYVALAVVATLGLGGCSYIPFFKSNNGPQYQDSKVMEPLKIPPDLLVQAPQPGVTIPGGAVTSSELPTNTNSASGGYGLFKPHEAAGQQPVEEKTLAGVGAQILGGGADLRLSTTARPERIWAALKAVLAADDTSVAKFSPEQGELVTGWRDFRSGLAFVLGHSVAPTYREKYTFHLSAGEKGAEILAIQQERLWNNPNGSSVGWKKVPADAGHNRQIMEAVQKRLSEESILAEMPEIKVTRYRDDRGPYLVLNAVPAKAEPAVQVVLQGLGYPVQREGTGVWKVQVRKGGAQAGQKQSFIGGIFQRTWDNIKAIWSSREKQKPVSVRVTLLRMKDDTGSVLETTPGVGKDAPKWSAEILDKLQAGLSPKNGDKA
ncbi:outer membrane protein assembly factor BamC [Acidithiobacillus ferrooxidans]|jgi:outer membrane protein assembly factor BamC|uniref:outer membrane protein assembly factor BamC n=1 Tax=Acidithiobacillus ferrooxidans TaxID=920 RepID=UPI001C066F5B|nr:outer membrane protein assembly factor BamC [Acidithiobacillus ferrooxidans]MBU2857010.1 outer membrane protein assembly factor BamC [Acidithiobacillus ferrooxidans]MBU2859617.1 outer membrane protein assembly factor BamC [Acidithiobacillus ferrooxidans]